MNKTNVQTAINNVERIRIELAELVQLVTSLNEEIGQNLGEGKTVLEKLIEQIDEKNKMIEQLENQKNDLKTSILNKKEILQEKMYRKDVLLSEIQSKKQDIDQLASIILNEEKNKTEISTEMIGKEERLNNIKRKIEEHQVLIEATEEETKNEIQARKRRKIEISEELDRIVSRSKALKYLIKKNIVNLPEISVIRSLNVPGVDTETNIRKTSGVSDQVVRKILMDLDERGVISFETLSGKVQKLTEIDI
ncbi:MAG: hypothetical protein ACTSQE_11945 [Candidatus Heimdallarchaeaceae archaeon]